MMNHPHLWLAMINYDQIVNYNNYDQYTKIFVTLYYFVSLVLLIVSSLLKLDYIVIQSTSGDSRHHLITT